MQPARTYIVKRTRLDGKRLKRPRELGRVRAESETQAVDRFVGMAPCYRPICEDLDAQQIRARGR